VKRYEREVKMSQAIDQFLDSYAEWIRSKGVNAKLNLISHAERLKEIDPTFTFQFDLNTKEAA